MRILLINPNYRAASIHGMGPQVPLGLLTIGGPLMDCGHTVKLLNAEITQLSFSDIVRHVELFKPQVVMVGHSGSTPAHSVCLQTLETIKRSDPDIVTVYGGIHPTYHARETLLTAPYVDIIVRGEGEEITRNLVHALATKGSLASLRGISYRNDKTIVETTEETLIRDFAAYRVGWELIEDWDNHQCWGLGRATVIQFSRGCPHQCSYCGQQKFWKKWRHRDPEALAKEIAWLYTHHDVRFFTFADENPTTSIKQWSRFLQAMIAQNVPVRLTASIRATDICRDEKLLPLYKQAGFCALLLGIESTNPETIGKIKKGSTQTIDAKAINLLRKNGILSIAGYVFGLEHDSWKTGLNAFRNLLDYDPDFINAMYATPFDWTDFYTECIGRKLVEHDRTKWDFRHQVLASRHMKPWQLFLMVKLIELVFHIRPKHILRMFAHHDQDIRRQMRWCTLNAGHVWSAEIRAYFKRLKCVMSQGRAALSFPGAKTLLPMFQPDERADKGAR
ncbi:MAG: cobalamin-dependent protein [Candidatus Thiodiazotropha sp.]